MKKSVGLVYLSLALVLSISLVSAGWFSDLFSFGKVTGNVVYEEAVPVSVEPDGMKECAYSSGDYANCKGYYLDISTLTDGLASTGWVPYDFRANAKLIYDQIITGEYKISYAWRGSTCGSYACNCTGEISVSQDDVTYTKILSNKNLAEISTFTSNVPFKYLKVKVGSDVNTDSLSCGWVKLYELKVEKINSSDISSCVPSCDGVCGDDGCGGTCGTCDDGYSCEDSTCVKESICDISTTISVGDGNTYTIDGGQYNIGVYLWSSDYALIKINGEVINNHLGVGDALRTDDLVIRITDYKYNDYIKLCLNDKYVSCLDCQDLIGESQEVVEGCVDGDLEKGYPSAYYVKSYVDSDNLGYKIYDKCGADLGVLKEAVCYSNGDAIFKDYQCPNGCVNGACVEASIEEGCEDLGGVLVHPDVCGGDELMPQETGIACCEYNTCGDGICQDGEEICEKDCISSCNMGDHEFKFDNSGSDEIEVNILGGITVSLLGGDYSKYYTVGKNNLNRLVTSSSNTLVFNETYGDKYIVFSYKDGDSYKSVYFDVEIVYISGQNKVRLTNKLTGDNYYLSSLESRTFGDAKLLNGVVTRIGEQKWTTLSIEGDGSFEVLYDSQENFMFLPSENNLPAETIGFNIYNNQGKLIDKLIASWNDGKVKIENNCDKSIEELTCKDSDGGKNYYEKGRIISGTYPDGTIINDSNSDIWDVCARDNNAMFEGDSNALFEFYCDENGIIQSTDGDNVYYCPNGCSDGACVLGKNDCFGCTNDAGKCIPYGTRFEQDESNVYCSVEGTIEEQKGRTSGGDWASCQNSYECESNLCSDGECIELNDLLDSTSKFKSLGVRVFCRIAHLFNEANYNECVYNFLGE